MLFSGVVADCNQLKTPRLWWPLRKTKEPLCFCGNVADSMEEATQLPEQMLAVYVSAYHGYVANTYVFRSTS